jgi:hypothetical protein
MHWPFWFGHWQFERAMASHISTFSWTILLALLVILIASLTMFLLLVRRWTTQRQWVSLAEWARQREFRHRPAELSELPAALQPLRSADVQIRLRLCGEGVTVIQLQTRPAEGRNEPNRWNVLVRRRPRRQTNPAGLRPANAPASLLDLFRLSQFPSLAAGHRFVVVATSSSSAHALSDSASRTLLPADIGLLLVDDSIVLDFSTRPFDPIELDRMLSLAEQLGHML